MVVSISFEQEVTHGLVEDFRFLQAPGEATSIENCQCRNALKLDKFVRAERMIRRFVGLSRTHVEHVYLHVLLFGSFDDFRVEWCCAFAVGAPSISFLVLFCREDRHKRLSDADQFVELVVEVLEGHLNHVGNYY